MDKNREVAELVGEDGWEDVPCDGTHIDAECEGCDKPGRCLVKQPLDFLHDPAAAWMLLEWWTKTDAGLKFVRDFFASPLTFGEPDLRAALVNAVLAAAGKEKQ